MTDKIFQLHSLVIDVQQLLEQVKYTGSKAAYFNKAEFHVPFLCILRFCSVALWSLRSKQGANIVPLDVSWLGDVTEAVAFLKTTITNYIKKTPNYFGDRNEFIMTQECNLVINMLSKMVNEDGSIVSLPELDKLATQTAHHTATNFNNSLQTAPPPLANLLVKLFWCKHYHSVPFTTWKQLKASFVEEYQQQQAHYVMDSFRDTLLALSASASRSPADSTKSYTLFLSKNAFSSPSKQTKEGLDFTVSYATLQSFIHYTNNKTIYTANPSAITSLFDAYQYHCNPHTTIYLHGYLYDAATSYPSPYLVRSLLGLKIVSIACGDQHVACITSVYEVYTWGKGSFGRLGLGSEEDVVQPQVVKQLSNKQITQISCGYAFTGFVSQVTGKLYTCGAGMNGRLGHGDETNRLIPIEVAALAKEFIISVQNGSVHSCILTRDGKIFGCGKADYCGHGLPPTSIITGGDGITNDTHDVLIPLPILALQAALPIHQISIASGGFHTMVLTKAGSIYTWGHNRVGQLGIRSTDPAVNMPRNEDGGYYLPTPHRVTEGLPVNKTSSIVAISCGWGHSSYLTSDGAVYLCGRNVEGQLGTPASLPVADQATAAQPSAQQSAQPAQQSVTSSAESARSARSVTQPSSAQSSVVKDHHFQINERGHLYQPIFTLTKEGDLSFTRVQQIACGGEHTLFYTGECDLIGVGLNNRGQLADHPTGSHGQLGHGQHIQQASSILLSQLAETLPRPHYCSFYQVEKYTVLEMACGYHSSMVLAGIKQPNSLRNFCSKMIRRREELWQQVQGWQYATTTVADEEEGDDGSNLQQMQVSKLPTEKATAETKEEMAVDDDGGFLSTEYMKEMIVNAMC